MGKTSKQKKNFKGNSLTNCIVFKKTIFGKYFLDWKIALDKILIYQQLNGVHNKMLSTTVKANFPWFYRYILRQTQSVANAWEELLAKPQKLNQNQCPECKLEALHHETCFPHIFQEKVFWSTLTFKTWDFRVSNKCTYQLYVI
jgi:hypothetical protein